MTPSARTIPVVTATYSEGDRRWLVVLPGNVHLAVRQAADVEPLVAKHAPGTAIQFIRSPGVQPSGA